MKGIIAVMLLSMLGYIACTSKTGSKNTDKTQKETSDTAVEKDLDTASEILGNGVVHP